ncbi:B12-binding domain-containing radical SAM protein [Fusibacter ferrireducens]|uniref:Cobalamin-dependent protein n=1 Tax=Fusibacter ferrireducens TaxID=2785058 RepID=A0ABR9ZX04_9FIRM|nr:radical SAM protein [Fusibacter ferrireducens]MBF4694683.1 cobalamin-dependent protein [Fusibacter ferrireducens]
MKILLVRPPRIKQAVTLSDFMFSEPIGLEMLYAVLERDHQVEILDMMCDPVPLKEKLSACSPRVVAITSLCIDVKAVIKIAQETRAYDDTIHIAVGGTQALLNPSSFFHDAIDYIFKFTTTQNITAFYTHLDQGTLEFEIPGILDRTQDYKGEALKGINEYILPNRKSTAKYRQHYSYFGYKPAAIMQVSQGCNKACMFCLRWRIEGREEVAFDKELIQQDLLNIEEDTIMFYDNDILGSETRIVQLLDLIESLNLNKNFIAYASVEGILSNISSLKRFKALGLKALLVGYETFNDQELNYYTKKSSTSDSEAVAKLLKTIGIDVWASFMAHPDWTKTDFKAFRKYVKKLSPQISSVSPLTPFPNLPLYKAYKERLLFGIDDYEKWSFGQVSIQPSNMSLRQYYYQMLVTNLYINLSLNQSTEMLNRFGFKSVYRLSMGSLKAFGKYIELMMRAND